MATLIRLFVFSLLVPLSLCLVAQAAPGIQWSILPRPRKPAPDSAQHEMRLLARQVKDVRILHDTERLNNIHDVKVLHNTERLNNIHGVKVIHYTEKLNNLHDSRILHNTERLNNIHDDKVIHEAERLSSEDVKFIHVGARYLPTRSLEAILPPDAQDMHPFPDAKDRLKQMHGLLTSGRMHRASTPKVARRAKDTSLLHNAKDASSIHNTKETSSTHNAKDTSSTQNTKDTSLFHNNRKLASTHNTKHTPFPHHTQERRSVHLIGFPFGSEIHKAFESLSRRMTLHMTWYPPYYVPKTQHQSSTAGKPNP